MIEIRGGIAMIGFPGKKILMFLLCPVLLAISLTACGAEGQNSPMSVTRADSSSNPSPESMNTQFIDKLKINDLLALYARYADTRQAEKQADLFAPDAVVNVFPSTEAKKPVQHIDNRADLIEGFQALNQYQQTFHFNGQSLLTVEADGQKATGETYNLAHHIKIVDGKRTMMVIAIRYQDEFVKLDGRWLFQKRDLYMQWIDTHVLNEEQI
jgi:hypothetical protein